MSQLTTQIYRDAQKSEIVALMDMPSNDMVAKGAKAAELNDQGFIIDREIHIWGWDPVLTMLSRASLGYTWVPNAFQPNLVDPLKTGVHDPGTTPTDMTKPWPNSIKVSLDPADYPPIHPATAPQPVLGVVGTPYGDGTYAVNIQNMYAHGVPLYKNGDAITFNGVTLYLKIGWVGVGPSYIWAPTK